MGIIFFSLGHHTIRCKKDKCVAMWHTYCLKTSKNTVGVYCMWKRNNIILQVSVSEMESTGSLNYKDVLYRIQLYLVFRNEVNVIRRDWILLLNLVFIFSLADFLHSILTNVGRKYVIKKTCVCLMIFLSSFWFFFLDQHMWAQKTLGGKTEILLVLYIYNSAWRVNKCISHLFLWPSFDSM
jgi:hypothetical protein